jgi:hypothetical protein
MDDYLTSEALEAPAAGAAPPEPHGARRAPDRFSDRLARWLFRALALLFVGGALWCGTSLLDLLGSAGGWRGTSLQIARLLPPLTLTVVALLSLATGAYRGETRRLWYFAYGIAAFFIASIIAMWIALVREPYRPPSDEVVIATPAQLDDFVRRRIWTSKLRVRGETPTFLPTGVFVKTTEFKDTENLFMSGYVWQKYTDGVDDSLTRGFVLPEAVDERIEEAYRRREGAREKIGWKFEAETRQLFHYDRFPFDVKDPWVRLWHTDFDRNVVLIPDLESYASTNPATRPGIESRLVLPGWRIQQSFFSYKLHHYGTNFGVDAYQSRSDVPELYFTIVAQREFLSTFFLLLLPILVMLVLIFIIVYNMPPRQLGGEGLYNISRICGSYMFILILNHVNLRRYVSGGIVYLEYFYVVLYFGILWVLLNAALYLKGLNPPGIRWRENLIAKLAFLPLLTGALLLVTYLTFRH